MGIMTDKFNEILDRKNILCPICGNKIDHKTILENSKCLTIFGKTLNEIRDILGMYEEGLRKK